MVDVCIIAGSNGVEVRVGSNGCPVAPAGAPCKQLPPHGLWLLLQLAAAPPRRFVLFWPSSHHRCAALSCRSRSAPARTELSLPNPVSGEQLRSLLRQRQAWALRPGLPLPAGCVTTACCPPPIDCPFNFFCSTVLSRSPPPLPCAPSVLNRSVLRLSRVSTAAAMISITWKAEVVDSSVGTCRRGSGAN